MTDNTIRSTIPVLVIGAGPTGLACAALLRRHGIDVRLIDRAASTSTRSKANLLWCRTLEVLDEIDLATAAMTAGRELLEGRYLAGRTRLATIYTNKVPGTRFQPTVIQQSTTEKLIADSLDFPIEWRTEAIEIGTGGELPEVLLRRPDGNFELVRAEYLVGCDGMRSKVRAAANLEFEGDAIDEDFVLGDVSVRTTLEPDVAYQFFGSNGFLIAVELPGGLWRLAGPAGKPIVSPGPDDLQRLADKFAPRGAITVTGAEWVDSFRISQRVAPAFRRGRIVLGGDAVHVHSPAAGQGLNSSIQDAHNLAWKLAYVVKGLADPSLLDSYSSERQEVAEIIRGVTRMQAKTWFMARTPLERLRRRIALRRLDKSGDFQHKMLPRLAQLYVDYARSPLSVGPGEPTDLLRPGLRLADVNVELADSGEQGWSLDLCSGTHVTILTTATDATDELAALAGRYPETVVLRTITTPAAGPLAALSGQLLGIRPDGHIGFRGACDDVDALARWLAGPLALTPATAPAAGAHHASRL